MILQKKKKSFLDLKKQHFFKVQKIALFQRGKRMLLARECLFFLFLNLIKISLERMHCDFAEEKNPFLTLKNKIFAKSKKIVLFLRA